MRHVVGTSVGRYLIRNDAPWPNPTPAGAAVADPVGKERTLQNSAVRDYSWPCLIVFVDAWLEPSDFGVMPNQVPLSESVPKTVYLPDGRGVPVCIVMTTDAELASGGEFDQQLGN